MMTHNDAAGLGKDVAPCILASKAAIDPLHRDMFALSAYPSLNGRPAVDGQSYEHGMKPFSLGDVSVC